MTHRSWMILTLIVSLGAVGCGSGDEDVAIEASGKWLEVIDRGEYKAGWQQCTPAFRKGVSAEHFEKSIGGSRAEAGELVSRKLRVARSASTLPQMPRGRYVVVQYDSVFKNHKATVETVTEQFVGGKWRVVGYRNQ